MDRSRVTAKETVQLESEGRSLCFKAIALSLTLGVTFNAIQHDCQERSYLNIQN